MVDETLELLVEEAIKEGRSLEQIEQQLRQQGWDDQSIQEAEKMAQQRLEMNGRPQPENQNSRSNQDSQELNYASLGQRAGAAVIDGILIGMLYVFLTTIGNASLIMAEGAPSISSNMISIGAVIAFCTYYILFEARSGRTLGKKYLDLQVVNADGSKIGFKESIIRNILRLIDFIPYYLVGAIAISLTGKQQRLGDLAAGTVVVAENSASSPFTVSLSYQALVRRMFLR